MLCRCPGSKAGAGRDWRMLRAAQRGQAPPRSLLVASLLVLRRTTSSRPCVGKRRAGIALRCSSQQHMEEGRGEGRLLQGQRYQG